MKTSIPLLRIRSATLILLLAAYFTCVLNLTFFHKVWTIFKATNEISVPVLVTVPITFFALLVILFTPLVSKYITKPAFIFLLITAAIVNYGTYVFGVVFNKDMITNIFETTLAEASSYLNVKLIVWLILSGCVPTILLGVTHIQFMPLKREILHKIMLMTMAAGIVFLIGTVYYKDYASVARNNSKLQKDIIPTFYMSSTIKYVKARFFAKPMPYQKIGEDAHRLPLKEQENYLVVVLVGETARAANYQWNGYNRETNAFTAGIPNMVFFQNTTSCGTATAISLPCMFSMMGREHYNAEKVAYQDNTIDILKRNGTQVAWIDNDSGCKGVCRNATTINVDMLSNLNCSGESCTDEVMLKLLDEQIESFRGKEGIVFLHLIGSHGPTYYKRYPESFARFKPDCRTSDLQKCTDAQIVNSYDNTILFTDYLMSKIVADLKTRNKTYQTALLYMSDHGESLGENGLYLHGMPYSVAPEVQKHVPFMLWLSDEMAAQKTMDMECLHRTAQTGKFSHDNLSHTLLNFMDVHTASYDQNLDVLYACEKEHK